VKLQKATRFGLYAVLELASDPTRHLTAADIAQTYGISTNHLAKVLGVLSRAGLVAGVRGASGGYRFAANPRRVTLLDIIVLFEDVGSGPTARSDPSPNTEIGHALQAVLTEIDDIAQATLRAVTLTTLIALMRRRTHATGRTVARATDPVAIGS
jgi:Rrf2 family protein